MKRKLAAILAADIAGYSKLMAEDEEATLVRLEAYRTVFHECATRYGGRIFNTAGDAVLMEFASAVEAVRCALDVQGDLKRRNDQLVPGRQMQFRIGIHIGDVVSRSGDLLGDGVNIAARLEGLAKPGGICVSRWVHEQVSGKLPVKFTDLGPQQVKNIPQPVHAYTIQYANEDEGLLGPRQARGWDGVISFGRSGMIAGALVAVLGIGFAFYYASGLRKGPGATVVANAGRQAATNPATGQRSDVGSGAAKKGLASGPAAVPAAGPAGTAPNMRDILVELGKDKSKSGAGDRKGAAARTDPGAGKKDAANVAVTPGSLKERPAAGSAGVPVGVPVGEPAGGTGSGTGTGTGVDRKDKTAALNPSARPGSTARPGASVDPEAGAKKSGAAAGAPAAKDAQGSKGSRLADPSLANGGRKNQKGVDLDPIQALKGRWMLAGSDDSVEFVPPRTLVHPRLGRGDVTHDNPAYMLVIFRARSQLCHYMLDILADDAINLVSAELGDPPICGIGRLSRAPAKTADAMAKPGQQAGVSQGPAQPAVQPVGMGARPEPSGQPAVGKQQPAIGANDLALKPGSVLVDCADCPRMVVVPAGRFVMGSKDSESGREADEGPRHEVTLREPFAVGQHAVTVGQFAAFVTASGYQAGASCLVFSQTRWVERNDRSWRAPGFAQGDDHPVVCVNWNDAKAYAAWLSSRTGKRYRLLSEAEREYAARAGSNTAFWWGSGISADQANYDGTVPYGGGKPGAYRRATVRVGMFKPNPWGLYQMHGNVSEWVEDCWNTGYAGAPTDGSAWISGVCSRRVLRGGGWGYAPKDLRAAYREGIEVEQRYYHNGFRVGRTLEPQR